MRPRNERPAFALLSTAILVSVILSFGLILVDSSLTTRRAARVAQEKIKAVQIAEAGIRKTIYCLNQILSTNCGGVPVGALYPGETNVTFDGGKFTTTLSGVGVTRTITSTGTSAAGQKAIIKVDAGTTPPTSSLSFSYALQAGTGGIHLENNSSVIGDAYANSDVDCQSTNAAMTGNGYVSTASGKFDSCKITGMAHADRILSSKVTGNAYYRTNPADIAGTTVIGLKFAGQPAPSPVSLPDIDLAFWRDAAETGGVIIGDYAPADNSALGPVKITGNLTLDQNVDITIKGPVWVLGNIVTFNNSSFTLDPAFGPYSTVILADNPGATASLGQITIVNNTAINGSGVPSSNLLLLSTNTSSSDTSPALSVANRATGAIFYAPSGTLRLQNNASAKALAGKRLFIDQRGEVTYIASQLNGIFSAGPSNIWRQQIGTWREVAP